MRRGPAAFLACSLAAASLVAAPAGKLTLKPVAAFSQHFYEGPFSGPTGIFFDAASGEIWVADTANDLVGAFTKSGSPLFTFGGGDILHGPVKAVRYAGGIAVVDEDRAHVKAFSYRGEPAGTLELSGISARASISTIAVDAAGNLYVGENAAGEVFVYTPEHKLKFHFGGNGADEGEFQAIAGIAVTPEAIYVTDAIAKPVQVFDRAGSFLRSWGKHEIGRENFSLPQGIAVDGRSHVIVIDALRHEIKLFDTDGTFLDRFGGLGQGPGEVAFPTDAVFDGEGRLYVVEKGNGRVQVFTAEEAKVASPGTSGR